MFEGFSPETVDFLWGIRMNNNRDWFLEHKKDYVNYLYEPMKALGKELFEPFLERPGNLLKVSRIYRDARLHHPLPYKESLWICIRRDVDWWAQHPCLYFEIRPEGVTYGFVLWQPTTAMLEQFRQTIAARPEEFLRLIRDTEKATDRGSVQAAKAGTYRGAGTLFRLAGQHQLRYHRGGVPGDVRPGAGQAGGRIFGKADPSVRIFLPILKNRSCRGAAPVLRI